MPVTYRWSPRIDADLARRVEAIANELAAAFPKVRLEVIDTAEFGPESYAATATLDRGRSAILAISSTMGNAAAWDANALADVASEFHPIGFCDRGGVEGVIAHEFGHVLAFLAGIPPSGGLPARIVSSWLSRGEPAEISQYATQSPQETLAEAFAEYRCSRAPRRLSAAIARTLIEAYRVGSPYV